MEGRARLESWKEISTYLERSVKTCQRWETELGLPIHRLDGTPFARVFADPDELDDWLAEKLSHIREKPDARLRTRRSTKKALRVAVWALALIAVAAVPARLWIWHPAIKFPATTPCVAFLPLENPSGDAKLEAWRTSFPVLITMDLVQSRVMGSVNSGSLFATLDQAGLWGVPRYSPEDVARLGPKIGCGPVATGSLTRSREGIALDLAIRNEQTGEVMYSFHETVADEEGLFDLADRLSTRIKFAFNIPRRLIAHDIDEKIGDITTCSPEAFHFYCQADRLAWQGKSLDASQLFQKAAEADPKFAEAYYGLFRACRGTLARDEIMRYGQKAVDLSNHLNVWSRYQLRGDFYQNFKRDYDKAIAAYRSLLELMDDDLAAYSLAEIFSDLEEYDKAIPFAELALKKNKFDEDFTLMLAQCQAGRGDLRRAVQVLDERLKTDLKPSVTLLHMRAIYAADQGEFDDALSVMERMRTVYPNSPKYVRYGLTPVLVTMDDFPRAERELRAIVSGEEKTQKVYAAMGLVGLFLTQGRLREARDEAVRGIALAESLGDAGWLGMSHLNKAYIDRASGDLEAALREVALAAPDPSQAVISDLEALHFSALLALEMGKKDDFGKRLENVRQLVEREKYPKLMRAYQHLLGERALRENDVEGAVDHFWKAVQLLPSPLGKSAADTESARYYASLAEAYLRAGAYTRAAEMFAKVPPYWEQRFHAGDVYARSFYGQAKAHDLQSERAGLTVDQKQAERAKAIESYRKFLSLWGGADPVFAPEVGDARKRLAILVAE